MGEEIDLKELVFGYLRHWKWFLISVFVTLFLGYMYIKKSALLYSASSTIMIKNDRRGGMSEELAAFKELSILGSNNKNVDNEIQVLKSRKIISQVVKKLNLNIIYISIGRIRDNEMYNNSPIKVIFNKKNNILN